jgi:DNA-binding beta-propeller fold protein YncE
MDSAKRTLIALAGVLAVLLVAPAAAPAQSATGLRDVLLVGNNWDGTVDVLDVPTYQRLRRINAIPDRDERMAEIFMNGRLPFFLFIREAVGEGHDQFVDDMYASKDGRTMYISRPSFADVIAMDFATGKIVWRTPVSGVRADHMAISPDGTRLVVSTASAAGQQVVDVLDTVSGKKVGEFPSGVTPHENVFSHDGRLIYHGSIGRVYTPTDEPSMDATKGERYFQIVDAKSLRVLRRVVMGEKLAEFGMPGMSSAVRPMTLSPDERWLYFQVSFFHGFVEYNLEEDRVTRVAHLPVPEETRRMRRDEYILDSAHHGIAMNGEGTKLCVAGTMSNYAAIVSRESFRYRIHPLGARTYWSTTSADGEYCYVSVAGDNTMAIYSYDTEEQVARVPVGYHPQRARTAEVATSIFGVPDRRRLQPAGLSLRADPVRERRAPFRFRLRGELRMPRGVRGMIGCSGSVRLVLARGRAVVARATARLRSTKTRCTYDRRVTVPARTARGGASVRLTASARFAGNDVLRPQRSRRLTLRVG